MLGLHPILSCCPRGHVSSAVLLGLRNARHTTGNVRGCTVNARHVRNRNRNRKVSNANQSGLHVWRSSSW